MSSVDSAASDHSVRYQKIRDRALVLPMIGILLLVSPLAGISQLDAKPLGVPFTLIYLFTVWAVLIAGACILAMRLRDGDETTSPAIALDSTTQSADEDSEQRVKETR